MIVNCSVDHWTVELPVGVSCQLCFWSFCCVFFKNIFENFADVFFLILEVSKYIWNKRPKEATVCFNLFLFKIFCGIRRCPVFVQYFSTIPACKHRTLKWFMYLCNYIYYVQILYVTKNEQCNALKAIYTIFWFILYSYCPQYWLIH